MYTVYYVVNFILQVLFWVLMARAILSWFANPYRMGAGHPLVRIYMFLGKLTEPLVKPARRLLSRFNTGPLDFSVFITGIFIIILQRVVRAIFIMFLFR